jgi:hypothetical protein
MIILTLQESLQQKRIITSLSPPLLYILFFPTVSFQASVDTAVAAGNLPT